MTTHAKQPQQKKSGKSRPYHIYGVSDTYGMRRWPGKNFATRKAAEDEREDLGYMRIPGTVDDIERFIVVDSREPDKH
ncbi:hypothetical protein [Acidithiobacillus concretivorus]|jgi:hypothetical protein|uniref:Uncharacterized protein n=1 Tax=Acidithiobacillus concretivorus TaxID=3063952 RepID=A0ABS5ZQ03_9PROT|nr:hypothetical protein [Acidithiobacillus concretivorus]MBU2738540.1 hypothetical protein [Acidithiobacillus concretivorus]